MEDAAQFRIEGLEEALEQISALSREISQLTESARIAASILPGLDLRLGLPDLVFDGPRGDSGSSSGAFGLPDLSFPFAEAPVGEVHRFTVQDNGEPGIGLDKFSGVPPNPEARECDDPDFGSPAPARVAPTRTVNRGNIEVR